MQTATVFLQLKVDCNKNLGWEVKME